jgi:hypothetical protein
VISRDIRVEDLDAHDWTNLLKLGEPDFNEYRARGASGLPLVLLLEGDVPVKAIRAGAGPMPLGEARWFGPAAIARARRAMGCSFLLAAEIEALRELLAELESSVRLDEDGVAQSLRVGRAVKARVGAGLYLDPNPLAGVPIPSYDAVQRTFDRLYPDDRATLFYLFDHGAIHTSLVTSKHQGDLALVTTNRALGVAVADWRRDYPRRFARPFLGIFAEVAALSRILSGQSSVSRELAAREVIFDPVPPWLMALVAADAGAQVAQASAGLLRRFVPAGLMQIARGVAERAAEGPFQLLGFNPFAIAGEILRVLRRPPAP